MVAVIVISGGLDSGVLLADSISQHDKIHGLSFSYGAKLNARELPMAQNICRKYGVPHHIVELNFIGQLFQSSLLSSGGEVPEGTYSENNMSSTIVPFRNGIMLSVAIGYAENIGARTVLIGSHSGDHPVYPDCRYEFTSKLSEAAEFGTTNGVTVLAPYASLTKSQIVEKGRQLDFDFSCTWTCYKGGIKHCGKCAACNERKNALGFQAGLDPTIYE